MNPFPDLCYYCGCAIDWSMPPEFLYIEGRPEYFCSKVCKENSRPFKCERSVF